MPQTKTERLVFGTIMSMLMALCMVTGGVVLFFNMLAQVLGEILDPRMEYEGEVEP